MPHLTPTPPAAGKGLGGRPWGSLAARPTAKQVASYRRDLHGLARNGDTLALLGIVLIDVLERQQQQEGAQ